jgi:hypothetical protein
LFVNSKIDFIRNFSFGNSMNKKILIGFILLQIASCATAPKLEIRSNIPARIEKNGTTVCATTPCTIDANHWRDGYDLGCVKGADTNLEAFSLEPNAGIRQSKSVIGKCGESTDVFFEMSSGGIVNTVSQSKPEKGLTQKLEELNDLKKRGLITEIEFQEKRKQALDSYK